MPKKIWSEGMKGRYKLDSIIVNPRNKIHKGKRKIVPVLY
jgi:hypothetical protein